MKLQDLKKLHAAHKVLAEKHLGMVHLTHHQYSATQRLQRPFVRGHTNLVGSTNFLGCITEQGTINFHSLCRCGVEFYSFSFGSNKYEILSPHVRKSKATHLPRSKLKMHNLTPPYNCVPALIRCFASTVRHKTRETETLKAERNKESTYITKRFKSRMKSLTCFEENQ